jgi:hypothetical protein
MLRDTSGAFGTLSRKPKPKAFLDSHSQVAGENPKPQTKLFAAKAVAFSAGVSPTRI